MNDLLLRLIKKHFPDEKGLLENAPFFDALSDVFDEYDDDRYILEQSLTVTSNELMEINDQLKSKLVEYQSATDKAQEELAKRQAQLDATPEAVFSFEANGTVSLVNRAGLELISLSREQVYQNNAKQNLAIFLDLVSNTEEFEDIMYQTETTKEICLSGQLKFRDGRFFEYFTVPEYLGEKYLGRVYYLRDVSKLKEKQKELKFKAFHDELTGLPNRAHLLNTLDRAILNAEENKTCVAVVFIDLDNFKFINDTAGHGVGDEFIIRAAQSFKENIRCDDIIGRLGGDEFLVIFEGISDKSQIEKFKQRLMSVLGKTIVIKNREYDLSCSIGLSLFPDHGDNAHDLIRKADIAMYEAKQAGKKTFYYFVPQLEKVALDRIDLESRLRNGIKNNEFFLMYQPKVDVSTGQVIGAEALIRWRQNDGSIATPNEFIEFAESTGLIHLVTEWVVDRVCRQIVAWNNQSSHQFPIAINISPKDFTNDQFVELVASIIHKYNIPHGQLEFEITENVFMKDTDHSRKIVKQLRALGVSISIDDFGTGFSSMSVLLDLDVDYLKIDKTFVSYARNNEKSAAIVKSIIDIARNLSVGVIAEGIEDQKDLYFVQNAGCNVAQGFYYSRPISLEDFEQYVERVNMQFSAYIG